MQSETVKNTIENLQKPLEIGDGWSFLRKGKCRFIIIYEDKSFKEFYKPLTEDYVVTIKKKKYVVLPEAVIFGKYNTFAYYYNNPMPVNFQFEMSKITADKMYDKENFEKLPKGMQMTLANTYIDSKTINVAFTSNLVNKMYSDNKMSTMNWIFIMGAVLVVILVILQVTGTVDVFSMITGVKN